MTDSEKVKQLIDRTLDAQEELAHQLGISAKEQALADGLNVVLSNAMMNGFPDLQGARAINICFYIASCLKQDFQNTKEIHHLLGDKAENVLKEYTEDLKENS